MTTFRDWTNPSRLGLLPAIINPASTTPVHEQIASGYAHGGGFRPINGFTLRNNPGEWAVLTYPEDPPFKEWGRCTTAAGETVIVFDAALVAIVQPDGTFVVTRMD